jgi:hypothetical protein
MYFFTYWTYGFLLSVTTGTQFTQHELELVGVELADFKTRGHNSHQLDQACSVGI